MVSTEEHELFNINPVVVLEFLTPGECESLLLYFQTGKTESGKLRDSHRRVNSGGAGPESIRNNTVFWLDQSEDTNWIYEKTTNLLNDLNAQKYRFAIDTLQTIQLAEYTSMNHVGGQFYKSHIDTCISGWVDNQRKLSMTVQLTHPEHYEGGDLLLFGDKNDMLLNPENFSKNIQQRRQYGAAIIFPSFLEHEVTPVTKGTRHSLVAWMQGPNWK